MIKSAVSALAVVWGMVSSASALSSPYTFQPNPADLGDLDHSLYYTWGIAWSVPVGEYITGASLTIRNINNFAVEPNNRLYIHLLDNAPLGVTTGYDGEGGGDQFLNQGVLLATYVDDDPEPNPPETWTHNFTYPGQVTALVNYLGNGVVGLGLDPDCHYFNDGITLTITTAPIPEPASLLLMAAAMVPIWRRRRAVH